MCRSSAEGGRRCQCTSRTIRIANKNRRDSRGKRRAAANALRDRYGTAGYRAVMSARPSELALIAARVEQFDPEAAATIRESVEGKFPGSHNMIMQDKRHAAVRTDYLDLPKGEEPELRDDPMKIAQAMPTLVAVEQAYLSTPEVKERLEDGDAEIKHLAEGAAVRKEAADLGIYSLRGTGIEGLTPEQEEFYRSVAPEKIARLGEVQSDVESKFRENLYKNVTVNASSRASLLTGDDQIDNAKDVAARHADAVAGDGLPVAEGVVMRGTKVGEGKFDPIWYEVDTGGDEPVILAAKNFTSVEQSVAKIPKVDGFGYNPKDSPDGQTSLHERMMSESTPSGKRNRADMTEAVIRSAYDADKSLGRRKHPLTMEEITVAGKSPQITASTLAGAGHRQPGHFEGPDTVTESSNEHLNRARAASTRELESALVNGGIPRQEATSDGIKRETSRRPRVLKYDGEELDTVAGMKMWATESTSSRRQGVADSRKKGMEKIGEQMPTIPATSKTTGGPVPASNFMLGDARNVITDAEIDEIVARANAVPGKSMDELSTDAAIARTRVDKAFQTGEAQERIHSLRGAPREPVTVASYSTIPAGMDASKVFREGTGFDPQGYVSAATGKVPRPSVKDGEQAVKMVYTTRSGLPVSDNRMVLGPDSRYRVLRTETDSDGTLVVHMVDDDILLAAGTGN